MSNLSGWAKLKHLPADDPRRVHARKYARENLRRKGGRKRTPEEKRYHGWKTNLKKAFQLTPREYEEILQFQHGVCAICQRQDRVLKSGRRRRLAVDHCHKTKTLRGLLCKNCNNGIGLFEDDILRLTAAIAYLRVFAD